MKQPRPRASLAGFNTSNRADRTTLVAFLASYAKAFPDRPPISKDLHPWIIKMLVKNRKPNKGEQKRAGWIPPSHYIPNNPSPRATYKRQATNIARSMRELLESQGRTYDD